MLLRIIHSPTDMRRNADVKNNCSGRSQSSNRSLIILSIIHFPLKISRNLQLKDILLMCLQSLDRALLVVLVVQQYTSVGGGTTRRTRKEALILYLAFCCIINWKIPSVARRISWIQFLADCISCCICCCGGDTPDPAGFVSGACSPVPTTNNNNNNYY